MTDSNVKALNTEETSESALTMIGAGLALFKGLPIAAASKDDLLIALNAIAVLKKVVKEATAIFNDGLIEKLGEFGGSVQTSETRWYVGKTTKVKRVADLDKIFVALWAAAGGDVDALDGGTLEAVCATLSSSAFKQAAVKQALGEDDWSDFFSKEVVEDVKTGKPKKEVKQIPVAMADDLAKQKDRSQK